MLMVESVFFLLLVENHFLHCRLVLDAAGPGRKKETVTSKGAMAEDREILREVWEGRIPVCINLAKEELDTVEEPDPYYVS